MPSKNFPASIGITNTKLIKIEATDDRFDHLISTIEFFPSNFKAAQFIFQYLTDNYLRTIKAAPTNVQQETEIKQAKIALSNQLILSDNPLEILESLFTYYQLKIVGTSARFVGERLGSKTIPQKRLQKYEELTEFKQYIDLLPHFGPNFNQLKQELWEINSKASLSSTQQKETKTHLVATLSQSEYPPLTFRLIFAHYHAKTRWDKSRKAILEEIGEDQKFLDDTFKSPSHQLLLHVRDFSTIINLFPTNYKAAVKEFTRIHGCGLFFM